MDQVVPGVRRRETPTDAERQAARRQKNGYIYRLDDDCDPARGAPPYKVQGAWEVDGRGQIVGDFQPNPNYGRAPS